MKIIDLTCTKCGSNLQINYEDSMTTAYCQYCGQKILLDPEEIEINVRHSGTIRHENINVTEDKTKTEIGKEIVAAVALVGPWLLIMGGTILLIFLHDAGIL